MRVTDFLDEAHVAYKVSEHRPTFTAQQMAAEEHVPGAMVAKPVVIKADGKYYLCVLPASYKIDLDELRMHLGADNVDLAIESEMARLFPDCALGAEPPFGNLYDMPTIMDKTLEADEKIVFQAGTHEKALEIKMDDYIRAAKPKILSFSYHTT